MDFKSAESILSLVFVCVGIIAYTITTILAIKRKKANGEKIDVTAVFDDIASKVLVLVRDAEENFSAVENGGKLKLKDVLSDVKDLCATAGVVYDKSYWTDFIGKAVNLINVNNEEKKAEKITAEVATADTTTKAQ